MDSIQSWSAFDQQIQGKKTHQHCVASATQEGDHKGRVENLYVSTTSKNIAPAALALLRQAGITNVNDSRTFSLNASAAADVEEEFRLKFHWMRPHPSLVLSLEEEVVMAATKKTQDNCHRRSLQNDNNAQKGLLLGTQQQQQEHHHPAVVNAKMMQAYRDSQIEKHAKQIIMKDEGNEVIKDNEESNNNSQSDKNFVQESDSTGNNVGSASTANTTIDLLPFELPKLRVDLASLVEPPLMTSWLPSGEDIDISYQNEVERNFFP